MKYTKKHLMEVRRRLLEYSFTEETGFDCFTKCKICTTVGLDCLGLYACERCVLDKAFKAPHGPSCVGGSYTKAHPNPKKGLPLKAVRARRKEIEDHLVSKGIEL